MLSFWAGGISSLPPCAREYRLLRRLASPKQKQPPPGNIKNGAVLDVSGEGVTASI